MTMDEKLSPEERILVLEDAVRRTIAAFDRIHSKLEASSIPHGELARSIDLLESALGVR